MAEGKDLEDLDERELNELGNAYSARGMWDEAVDSYLRSLAKRRSKDDPSGQALVLNNLGGVYYQQGRLREALECYEASVEIARDHREDVTELMALMNLVLVHFVRGEDDEFLRYAEQAEGLASKLERWEPLSRLSWLRGRLALEDAEAFQAGLHHYAQALDYSAREGEEELQEMLDRIDAQAEVLLEQGARGLALVLYDYLEAFAADQSFSEALLSRLSKKREEILRRPSLS